jgi:hypothetical protein
MAIREGLLFSPIEGHNMDKARATAGTKMPAGAVRLIREAEARLG